MASSMIVFYLRRGGQSGGRMCVGFRTRDWTPVWYEPVPNSVDDDGGAETAYFSFENGEAMFRAPMSGEVKWLPWFDPMNHESNKNPERERLQRQTLKDAYDYAVETDQSKIDEMENEYDNPQFPRQYSWFVQIRKWKKANRKQRNVIRKIREDIVREVGEDPAACDINSDDSEPDSGYEDAFRAPQPSPPAGAKSKKKKKRTRRGSHDSNVSRIRSAKKSRRKSKTTVFTPELGESSRTNGTPDAREPNVEHEFEEGIDFDSSAPDIGNGSISDNVPATGHGPPLCEGSPDSGVDSDENEPQEPPAMEDGAQGGGSVNG